MITRLHYSDLLSGSDGRLVSRDGIEGVYRLFDAVAGPGVSTLTLAYLGNRVRDYLRTVFPDLADPRIEAAIGDAIAEFKRGSKSLTEKAALFAALERHVRPLMPSDMFDVPHWSDDETGKALKGYKAWLDKTLAGKEVIVVGTGEAR